MRRGFDEEGEKGMERGTKVDFNKAFWVHVKGALGIGVSDQTELEPLGMVPVPLRGLLLTQLELLPDPPVRVFWQTQTLADGKVYRFPESWEFRDPAYRESLFQRPLPGDAPRGELWPRFPLLWRTYQLAALGILYEATAAGVPEVVFADDHPGLPLLELAILDVLETARNVARLWGVRSWKGPTFRIVMISPSPLTLILLEEYCRLLNPTSTSIFNPLDGVVLCRQETLPSEEVPLFVGESLRESGSEGHRSHSCLNLVDLDEWIGALQAELGWLSPLSIRSQEPPCWSATEDVLHFFARRFFPLACLKDEQTALLLRLIGGGSCLGVLPTGFGKSLVYQLLGILFPGLVLIISPLISLIRDQLFNLSEQGLICATALFSGEEDATLPSSVDDLDVTGTRLLFIAPERLRIRSFLRGLRAKLRSLTVRAIAVDEAHCLSEWGYDFRPAYLQIADFRAMLKEEQEVPIPLAALTATASSRIEDDICKMLDIPSDSLVRSPSLDRPNLTFSAWELSPEKGSHPEGKILAVKELLCRHIPRALKLEGLFRPDHEGRYPHSGLVFGFYAAPQGASTYMDGVHYIAANLRGALALPPNLIRAHASKAARQCPACGSRFFRPALQEDFPSEKQKRPLGHCMTCLNCGRVVPEKELRDPAREEWEREIHRTQQDFKQSRFPLLVATKGYGMGIDKGNIRYVVHNGFSSGIMGYYQEAGRAGRDGQVAHVALVYLPPCPDCVDEIQRRMRDDPKAIPGPRCHASWACGFGRSYLCDFGKQSKLLFSSFQGEEKEVKAALDLFVALQSGKSPRVKNDEELKKTELALFRLRVLRTIKSYSLDYRGPQPQWFVEGFDEPAFEVMFQGLSDFLRKTDLSEDKIAECPTYIWNQAEKKGRGKASFLALLEGCLGLLIRRIYQVIPRTRFQMLLNEYQYARGGALKEASQAVCRRALLLNLLGMETVPDDYRCERCDVCRPDLDFQIKDLAGEKADGPRRPYDQLVLRLQEALGRPFSSTELDDLVEAFVSARFLTRLWGTVLAFLEQASFSLSALYLAGQASLRMEGGDEEALRYLSDGFREALIQLTDREGVLAFYRLASDAFPDEAYSWLYREESLWRDDRSFCHKEACRLFGDESAQARTIRLLLRLERLERVKKPLQVFVEKRRSLDRAWRPRPERGSTGGGKPKKRGRGERENATSFGRS